MANHSQNANYFLAGILCIIPLAVLSSQEKRTRAIEMMTNPMWVTQFTLMLGFVFYILYVSNDENVSEEERHNVKNMRRAMFQGAMAFLIAICAVFDFSIAPFWLVFLSSYFYEL